MQPVDKAISSLVSLSTPQSQLKLASRCGNGERYLLVSLQDGRWISIDRQDRNKAYLLNKQPVMTRMPLVVELESGGLAMIENYAANRLDVRPAGDGEYPLERSGKIIVKGGVLADISGTPGAVAAPGGIA